jgi:hypothetical protein
MAISPSGLSAILLMVEASAPHVAPASVPFMQDFADYLKEKKDVPGIHPATADSSATPFMDALVSEIGLTLLASIAKAVLIELRKKAAEKGVDTLWNFFQKKLDPTKSLQDLSNEITLKLTLPPNIPRDQIRLAVAVQLQALTETPSISKEVRVRS